MGVKTANLIDSLRKFASGIKDDLGARPVVLVDTGTIIDIDAMRREKVNGRSHTSDEVYGIFHQLGIPLFVPTEILEEVTEHRNNYTVCNGRCPEISEGSYRLAQGMHRDWVKFVAEGIGKTDLDIAQYDAHLASFSSFPRGHKKRELDLPSYADRQLLASALWSSNVESERIRKKLPSGVGILSPDAHIIGSVSLLTDPARAGESCYKSIKAYDPRRI